MIKTSTHHLHRLTPIVEEIATEIASAVQKHPEWPRDIIHQWAIVQEEAGETQKDVLQWVYDTVDGDAYMYQKEKVRAEAVQTAAMCLRFLVHLDDVRP
ncbi:MAG: hypothetical protein Q8L89_04320 [Gammaproteobacteria bacterium]|nr:hypothetical protein [Gammaproteobacteria bacterium]